MSVFIRPYDVQTGRFIDEGMILNATISENHRVEYNITDNPRENTLPVTDNIFRNPRVLDLECSISDDSGLFLIGGIVNDINRLEDTEPYSVTVWEYLKRIADEPYALYVETALEDYANMYIQRLGDVNRNLQYSRALRFSMVLKEVIVVSSDTSEKEADEATSDRAAAVTNKGKKSTTETSATEEASINRSTLKSGVNLIFK